MDFDKILKVLPNDRLFELFQMIEKEVKLRRGRIRVNKKSEQFQKLEEIVSKNKSLNYTKISEIIQKYNLEIKDPVIPRGLYNNLFSTERQRALIHIMNQDWSSVYPCSEVNGSFYVYAHIDTGVTKPFCTLEDFGGNYKGIPFYIGKGTGDRAYDLNRNQGHGKKLRQVIEKNGKDNLVKIIFNNLSEQKALELESKLIFFFGTIYEQKRKRTVLYNLNIPTQPNFKVDMTLQYNKSIISEIKGHLK